uniref:Nesprin-1 n=2 Tax=Culex pipiens TaxID=7175 RepID=A0A8D8BCI2_CULPI
MNKSIDVKQLAEDDANETNRQPKCEAKKLTTTSSVLNIPMKQSISNSDDPDTPKRPTELHSLGSTNNVALNYSEQNDPESTIDKQILPHDVENILESLLSAELKMNNLPYDNINDLIKGLQVLIEKLADYKQQNYAISMSLPSNADMKIQESIRQIDDRIDFLRQRAHDGLEKIQQTLKIREQRKKEVQAYLSLLEEIESWLSTSSIQLDDVDDDSTEDDINQMLYRNQNLLRNLTVKETNARAIYEKTDEFLMYSDVSDRTKLLKENLSAIIRTMREKTLIVENNIQRLTQKLKPIESTMVNTEMQTSPPVSLDVYNKAPVVQQDTSSQTHKTGSTDNILIIQSVSNGQETLQISNVRNTPLMGTTDDIIVEAKYTHPQEGEGRKSSELLLQNIPSQFESTFVEPDDSTTEIVVDKDGSKKITLRKTIQPIQSIGPCEIPSTSTLDATILPPVIEGTVLEVQQPKLVSEEVHVARNIVGEILDNIQEHVVDTIVKKESELLDTQEQDSQVFESDALKVDLIASVVDSPSTSTVFSLQSTSEPYSNLTAKTDSNLNASVVEPVGDIWPPSESITIGEFGSVCKPDNTTTARTVRFEMMKPEVICDEIWPQSLKTGSSYFDVAPQFPTLPSTNNDDSTTPEKVYQDEQSISIYGGETVQEISLICKESEEIQESEQQVVDEALEAQISMNEIEKPSTGSAPVLDTSIIQPEPATASTDKGIEPTPDDVHPKEKYDSLPVAESLETDSKDDGIKAPAPDVPSEETRIGEAMIESYETKSKHEDVIADNETCGDDRKEQLTDIQQTKCESDGKLKVQVASTKEEQSSIKLTMNIVPLDAKKISVSLIEIGHTDSKTVPTEDPSRIEESNLSKDLLASGKIPGLSDIDFDKGYDADKTTVDGESETDESQKKKKRKKKKQRNETDKAINTEMLESPVVPVESIALDSRAEEQRINETQESIVDEPIETSSFIQERLIVSTEVIEAVYVEDVQQQTTPVEFEHPDFGLDQEVSKLTSEKLIVPIDIEQKSMQTSPEPEIFKMSHQTSPIQTSAVACEAKEIQTTMQVCEIETQTLNTSPKHQIEQESQTEVGKSEFMDKSAETPVIDVVDTANQTIITKTAEMEIQTIENVGEIVEPLVTSIINLAVKDEVTYTHHSIQTSPISFEPSKQDVLVLHESIQTIQPEILDAYVETEQILQENATSPVTQETKSDVQIQTSPIHKTAMVLGKCDTPNTSGVENVNQDTQTIVIDVVDNQAQTNPEPPTGVSKIEIPCTENSKNGKTSSEKSKKKMKKRKSDGKLPLQVEVTAQFEIPDSCAEIDAFTVKKTIISETNVDSKSDLDIHVQLDIDPTPHRSESFMINEVILDEKIVTLGLHNYLSILKSQQSYAEHKKVPWSEMASMLENVYRAGNSVQTPYPNALRTTSVDAENQEHDYLGLGKALSLLQENSTDATMQNQILFEILESISTPTEEIIADINKSKNLDKTDCFRICEMHRQRLVYILEIIQRIIIFITSNSTQPNNDVVKCFELTANELRHLDNEITSLETEYRRKQVYTDDLAGTLQDVNAQFDVIDEKLSNVINNETLPINKKLLQLDELEQQYLECAKRLRSVPTELQTIMDSTFDSYFETLLETAGKKSRKLSHSVIIERNKLNQLNSLAEEYEQTLLEFQDITDAAESFIKNNIVTNSLEELQEEMQRYRKFFVNLNHCKMILESLESNLDPITRLKHAELHSSLYNQTASILEKAVDKAAKLAQVASKWTILQKEMRNESQWLQIAQQRVPDLQNVSSEDFEQFITLYESLYQDIVYHHAKMIQQNDVAKKMQEHVSAPILEKESNEALTVIVQLREEVSLHLNMLVKYKLHWNNYNNSADKLGEWICSCQKTLREIHIPSNLVDTPVEDMRNFWEIKAQYEVLNNKVYKSACDSFDRALSTVNVSDEPLQRQLHGQLLENWLDVSSTISQIQNNISESMKTDSTTVRDKIAFIEQELQEITTLFNNTKGVLKSQEDLYAYIEKIQMLRTRIHLIDSELGQIALGADSNTEKISDIFGISRNISQQINEEYEAAETFFKFLEDIENGIKEEEINLSQISKILDTTNVNCKRPDVQKSLDDCIQCQLLLSDSWNKLMRLRQMLHTLPMNLKVSVSPLQTERALSLLQTTHNDLEQRCGNIIIQLKHRLTLWNKFHRQLEMIQEHIQETEFMMELMQLQENADYQRLLTATERLDALLIEIDSRKNTVEDLKSIAQPLIETSDESVSLEIQETVQKITVVWQNTRESLKELCQRYEKAVKLWQHYHDVCKNVKHWVEHEASDTDTLEYMNEISQLEVYQNLIVDKRKDLEQLKDLINNINVQVGFNVTGPLMLEIEDFSHKIEEIEENVISHKADMESNNFQSNENRFVLSQAQQLFDNLQQSYGDHDFNTDLESKVKHLREYMINLCATESRLEDILNGKQNGNLPESEVKNLHLISQSLLQDSLEQYQCLMQKIILHGNDENFINFWDNYMTFVKTFLEQDTPCDDTELRKLRNQYSLIAHLLKDLRALIMKKSSIEMSHAAKYNCLNEQHSYCITTAESRLVDIESRLRHWDKYNSIKSTLKQSISYIEREKYSLQLVYISLKEISKMQNKVNELQMLFPQIEQDLDDMQRETSEILSFTKDEHIMIQIRSDHGKLSQQTAKLKESIETWIDFLSRIANLHEHFHSKCDQIHYNLVELTRCLEDVKIDSLGASQHHLNMLKNEQLRLVGIKDTLTTTNEIRDELKQRISVFDAKLIHQRVWQLWQMFEKLDYSLSVLLKQMQERLQNLKLFSQQYIILTNWMMEFENRINDSNKYQTCEDDATFIKSVEELLLQELLLKENEIEWFNIVGVDLANNLQKGDEQLEIKSKLELLNSNWKRLKTHCHNRTQKIQEVNSTTISLQRRIEDIKTWMNIIEHDLKSPFLFETLDDSTLNILMDQYDNLQRSIESNSGNVGEVLNLCEMLFTDVESWNVHIDRKHVLHDINNLELRWKNICLESTKRKADLLSIWNMLLEIEKITNSHQEWVEKCNRYLDTLENFYQSSVNIENISEIFEELAIRQSDMIAQEPISHILRKLFVSLNKHERADAANMRNVTNVAKRILSIWECLLWRSNNLKKELSDLQTMHTVFINEYENIIMALTQIDVQVINIKHLSEAKDDTPEIKRKRLRDLHNELRFVINLFDKQDELGTSLIQRLSMPNSIHLKIQEYHDFANNIKSSLDALLSETIQESDKQKSQHSSQIQTECFEKDSAVQVNTLPALSHGKSITAKEAYQYQLESALVEARGHLENLHTAINEINVNNFMTSTQKVSKVSATCESSIELIKHLNLMVLSETQSDEEDTMNKLVTIECDKFTQYQTEWRSKQQKLEELSNDDYLTCPLCTNRNWQQIDNDLWRLEQWLQMAEANQKSQHTNPPTDIDTLEDTIQDHREFLLDLDSHKSIIKSLNIVGEHLATHTLDTEKAVRLRERLQADNQRWEKVCSLASHWQSQLHHALMDNKEFHRTVTELCAWLEQTENKIKSSEPIDLTSDMKLMERKYKTFRELRSDLVRCEPRVVSLQETTSQLTKYLEANKSQQFDEIYAKLTDLRLRFHSIRRLVEMYTIKIAAALGYDPTFDTNSIASVDTLPGIQGVSGSLTRVAGQESNANAQEGEDDEHINTTVLTRSYRFLGRVVRASLPIQAMLLLLLGVVTLMPHGEDYSCTLTNNFARSLEPMLRYPNGPPPI